MVKCSDCGRQLDSAIYTNGIPRCIECDEKAEKALKNAVDSPVATPKKPFPGDPPR
jgi:tRNA(Ile2) C34 agmatinyltransferase TiaS